MKHFDEIYEHAEDNYGIVTTAKAVELGVSRTELSRFTKTGRLRRLGNGVYKLAQHTPTPFDAYAEAVALAGPDSWIHGESVLAMCRLALVSPPKINVASERRIRKTLPPWIIITKPENGEHPVLHEGIPIQSVPDAIRLSQNSVLPERLMQAVEDALADGLITEDEATDLRGELSS